MDDQITAHFYGPEPTKQSVKSLTFPITSGSKSLTVTLEQFQKEMNSYLTDCIEKNPTSQPSSFQPGDDEELESDDEEEEESSSALRPSKLPKLV